ncbi:MAG: site-specific integrase [Clostridiales bacterium]|nr:site-specific integrase [Clostridiales bacterium]
MPIYKMQGKKDGLQKYRVRINYTTALGEAKQIDRVAYGLEEAKELERRLNYEIHNQGVPQKMTLQTLFEEYVKAKSRELRESTLDKSKRIVNQHILPTLGNISLDKLTRPVLQKWKIEIEDKNLALKTRQNTYTALRSLLNYAVSMEYIPKNPLVSLGNFKDANATRPEINYYTPEEFIQFIEAARTCAQEKGIAEWDYYVFFNIAFYTGLRKGEIYALTWNDIQQDSLEVKRSITQKLKGADRETPPKNKSSYRTLQLPKPLITVLDEHKKRCKKVSGFKNSDKICGGKRCIRDTSLQNKNKHYAELAGVKTIRIHDFRHSHASLLANEGINIQEIARRLGHAKIEMTWNTYSHLYPREEERAVNILNKIETNTR